MKQRCDDPAVRVELSPDSRAVDGERPSRQGGFSLLEVLVALGILSIGISTAIALFAAATTAHKRAIDRVHLAAIVEQVVADVESALSAGKTTEEIIAEPPLEEVKRNFPGYEVELSFYDVQFEAEEEGVGSSAEIDLDSDVLLLEVRVIWSFRGARREENFRQMIAREKRLSAEGWGED